ncbi:MAG: MATE family efflux transporter [Firmicutes bacterium]|nr:MATE family efflux transporter [Bacillota bacterium]
MKTNLKSDILSVSTIKKVMPSCQVYAFVQSMTFMVDTILAGHFLNKDAVAAVAMGIPMIGMMLSFTGMILQGGFLKMLERMGKSDMDGYNRIFSLVLAFTIVVDLVFLGLCIGKTDSVLMISGAAKATEQAVIYGRLYLKTACLMIIFFAVGSIFQLVSATFGYQTERMISSVVNVVLNIAVSVIALKLLSEEYKIAGLGIGSAAGAFGQMISAYILMKQKKIKVKFRLYPPNKENIITSLDFMRRGLPSSIDNILDSASGSIVNNIVLSIFANGTEVLALVAMIKTINSLVRTLGRGTLYASEPLFGILHGERDNDGICRTFKASLKYGLIYAAATALILIVLQSPILHFYGVDTADGAHIGLILTAISAMILLIPYVFNSVYESTNHLTLAMLVSIVPDSILYPVFAAILGKAIGVTGIWLAMGYSFIPFFIVFYTVFILINKKIVVPFDRLLVLNKYEGRHTVLDISIPIEAQQVTFVSERLQKFFLENGISSRIAMISALCMEEISADYLEHRRKTGNIDQTGFMDIKAFRDSDKIEIILRNYDKPYDPLIIEREGNGEDDFSKIGIVMTQKIASEILYSYAYHLNVVSVIIPISQ